MKIEVKGDGLFEYLDERGVREMIADYLICHVKANNLEELRAELSEEDYEIIKAFKVEYFIDTDYEE